MSQLNKMSRRDFLKRTGHASGGLVLALTFTTACSRSEGPAALSGEASVAPNVYVNIRNDGIVEIVCHRSEMGQGIRTSLPQIIADEMEADWSRIELKQALADDKYGDQNTDGSTSIRKHFDLLRNAGATAREMLIAAAAATWDVPASDCVARDHAVHHEATSRSAGFGELVDMAAQLDAPTTATFKSRQDYRYIGKPMDTIDGQALTTGTAMYGIDTALPGMLYASIERCPVFGGTVASFDGGAARKIAGVSDVVEMPPPSAPAFFNLLGGVAVLASNTWAAEQGRKALQVEWDEGANSSYNSAAYKDSLIASASAPGAAVLERGDVDGDAGEQTLEAVYYAPHLSHAPMEPPAAVATMTDDGGCEVWACVQNPQATRDTVAATLGLEKAQVIVHVTLLGGGFGRKSKPDFAAEAAWLAQQSGQPVKVTWTREDDVHNGYLHSVSAQYFRGGLDANGDTRSWLQRVCFPTIMSTFSADAHGPGGFELDLGLLDNPYDIPNMRLETCDAEAHLRIGWLRSVCNVFHAFGASCFADELAHLAGQDPKDYLIKLIGRERMIDPASDGGKYTNYGQPLDDHPIDTGRLGAIAEKVADMADWGRQLPDGHGLGIAVHRSFLSYVGSVAEVSIDASGRPRVHKMWMAIDAGQVINPDRVHAQMEGAAIFGMSIALHGEITAENGAVVQSNFDTYPVVRMNEAPAEIQVHIVESAAAPGGVGEPGVPPVAPAIANAVFAASGKRVRELPIRV